MSTRVAVVDLGSNSSRLLIADVHDDGTITEVERRSTVTRLAEGVDVTGRLAEEAMARVRAVLAEYRDAWEAAGADAVVGVLTSAVRDAANGAAFAEEVRRLGVAAHVIPGETEARLTYRGATSERRDGEHDPVAVIDIGGGSTEIVVGQRAELRFHVSTQVGVVRHTERHLHDDPPTAQQLQALRADAAATFADQVRPDPPPAAAVAVGGTATQSAAILGAEVLTRDDLQALLDRLAALPLHEREQVERLDPARAPTIVAGVAILLEALSALGLDEVEASDHDILRGAALEHTAFQAEPPQFSC
jgi:exopolyphosphatase/guanosine-5'-triphosphate,3'-diphosphate pyrophosphatase